LGVDTKVELWEHRIAMRTSTMPSAVSVALLLIVLATTAGCGDLNLPQPQSPPEPPEVAFVRPGCLLDDGVSPYGCQADSSLLGGGPRPVGLDQLVFHAKAQDNKWRVASVRIELFAELHCIAPPNLGANATVTVSRVIAEDPVNGQPDNRPPTALPRARLLRGELDVADVAAHCANTYGVKWSTRSILLSVSAIAGNGAGAYHTYGPARYTYRTP
jgi:hypothetical protein